MMHLGWFLKGGIGVLGWGDQWAGDIRASWTSPARYIAMAQALEEAGFDYIMIEDSLMIRDTYQDSMDFSLRRSISAPKLDPMPMVPLIAQGTRHIGIIATLATTFNHPFHSARLAATLDHLTNGRVGLNLVTASAHRSAQNFGYDRHFEHDHRYEMANEWFDVVDGLLNSWEPDAVVGDTPTATFTDPAKVKPIHFEGRFYKSRGPLNVCPGPQRRPVICQAGGSPAGRGFAARVADTIVAAANGPGKMKAYRHDMSERMRGHGRDPATCKMLFLVSPIVRSTDAEARDAAAQEKAAVAADLEARLSNLSYMSGVDMAQFDLDGPVPEVMRKGDGHQSVVDQYGGRTLREALQYSPLESVDLVGSPDAVAAQMDELMQEVGGDGFLIANTATRKAIAEIADGLAPALRRRGLIRSGYDHALFRDNLLAF